MALQDLDDSYSDLRPEFAKIELSEDVVQRMDLQKDLTDPEMVRTSLLRSHNPSYDGLQPALRGKSGWTIFQKPLSASSGVLIDGKPVTSRINQVRCNLVAVEVRWPSILENPVIREGKWKTSEGWVVSDGEPSTENSKEVVPRLNTSMILADKWEMTLDNAGTVGAIQTALKAGRKVSLSGIELFPSQVEFPKPTVIKINTATVLGIIDQTTPKIPNR